MNNQMAREHAQEMMDSGASIEDANVTMIRIEGVRLVRAKMPRQIRTALMGAVKKGQLGRLPKDGLRPEAFFHPNAKAKALSLRDQCFHDSIQAMKKICI